MYAIQVEDVFKSFRGTRAVNGVSFAVERGEILGILGPNGAGKTTTIRLVLDIYQPDSGTVSVLGGPMTGAKKDCIGYIPEERGFYQDVPLQRCLAYLGRLKGMAADRVHDRLELLLERFDLASHRGKRVKELSKGMQQKAQIIAAILHRPELIIIDEPFTALDPINVQMVKGLIEELHREGTTILMSSHQMNQIEVLCDRILLINKGEGVLYGRLEEIRRLYTSAAVVVRVVGDLPRLEKVESAARCQDGTRLTLRAGVSHQDVLQDLLAHGVSLEKFEVAVPTLDEIFVQVVGGND